MVRVMSVERKKHNQQSAFGVNKQPVITVFEMWEDKTNPNLFAINFNVGDVVLEHCGHIDFRELVLTEHNEQTGLSTGSISHYNQLFPDCCHSCR